MLLEVARRDFALVLCDRAALMASVVDRDVRRELPRHRRRLGNISSGSGRKIFSRVALRIFERALRPQVGSRAKIACETLLPTSLSSLVSPINLRSRPLSLRHRTPNHLDRTNPILAVGPSVPGINLSAEPPRIGSGWHGATSALWDHLGQRPLRSHRLHRLRFGSLVRWRGCPRLVRSLSLSD
jgi:hypothetical protein